MTNRKFKDGDKVLFNIDGKAVAVYYYFQDFADEFLKKYSGKEVTIRRGERDAEHDSWFYTIEENYGVRIGEHRLSFKKIELYRKLRKLYEL